MKILVVGDGHMEISNFLSSEHFVEYLDLRGSEDSNINLMDLYESVKPELIGNLRNEIINRSPEMIVSVGGLEGYGWTGTVVCRSFGQFNSWLGQYGNPIGKTVLKVDGRDVPMVALTDVEDWNLVLND